MELLGKFVYGLFLGVVGFALGAYTGQCLWNWFIAKQFHIMELSLAQAYGLMLTVKFFTITLPNQHVEASSPRYVQYMAIAASLAFLTFGFILSRVI